MGILIKDGKLYYRGEETSEGIVYKDLDAWNNYDCKHPIYISEAQLEEYEDWTISDEELRKKDFWTRKSWIDWLFDELLPPYKTREFAEYIAEGILYEAEWADLSTYFNQWSDEDIAENWAYFNEHKK